MMLTGRYQLRWRPVDHLLPFLADIFTPFIDQGDGCLTGVVLIAPLKQHYLNDV